MPPSPLQCKQRLLAWKLRMVKGAIGTLSPRLYPREELDHDICNDLLSIVTKLEHLELKLKRKLKNL